jgi:hypothetical protein
MSIRKFTFVPLVISAFLLAGCRSDNTAAAGPEREADAYESAEPGTPAAAEPQTTPGASADAQSQQQPRASAQAPGARDGMRVPGAGVHPGVPAETVEPAPRSGRLGDEAPPAAARPAAPGTSRQQAGPGTAAASRTIPANTALGVRVNTALSTKTHKEGQDFAGVLTQSVTHNGVTVIPAGSPVRGVIERSDPGGRVSGRAEMVLRLTSIIRDGQTISITTAPLTIQARGTKTDDAAKIGVGAGVGAAIGGIAGGGKGAAIGAAAGAGAGTGAVLLTHGDAAAVAAETVLTFQTASAATVR